MVAVDAPKAVARIALAIFAALASLFVLGVITDTPVAAQDQTAQEEPQLFADPGASAGERYIVKYRDRGRARDAVRGRKGHVVLELPGHRVIAARLTDEGRQALEADASVEYVELDPRRYPMAGPPWPNVLTGAEISPYGIQMVQADQVSDAAAGNRMVCIIDSGYYRAHDDLQYSNVTSSPDIGTGDPFVDRSSHGTHVAGTISAIGNNGTGVRGVTQNQNLRIHIVKVFGDDGVYAYSSTLIHALTQCRNAGANVVSMSLGGAGSSATENAAFQAAFDAGVLSVAAAGNGGSTAFSFPASYASVMSVGGVDNNETHYVSSQRNNQVDIAAPAVAVLSTITRISEGRLVVAGNVYLGSPIEFSLSSGGSTGLLADGGFCGSTDPTLGGKVVLCQRGGGFSFLQKVQSVQASGGVAAVIYNNVPGLFSGTLGAGSTSTIPAISLSQADGLAALAFAGEDALVSSLASAGPSMEGYSLFNGTSMATPHVSAVAALVWSHNPAWTNVEIRDALEDTARDIGAAGRDDFFGHGIVQAKAALDHLCPSGCAPTGPAPAPTIQAFVDTSEGDFDTGGSEVNASRTPGDLRLSSTGDPEIDQQDVPASTQGVSFTPTSWTGQTFTAGVTGQLVRVDLNLFCAGPAGACAAVAAPANVIVSIRATSGDLPTGNDLASATVPGDTSGALRLTAFTFATPVNITAGTRYAIVARSTAIMPGGAVYAALVGPAGQPDTYLAGRRVFSGTSGVTWVAGGGGFDLNFRTYATGPTPHTFAPSGTFVSAIMDAKPATGFAPQWNELSLSATTPPGTSIRLQVGGSESAGGPFNFVGPDGTNASFFTASNFALTQFDGYRHLRYAALLETSDPSVSPVLHDVTTTMGTVDAVAPVITGVSVDRSVLWSPNHQLEDVVVSYQVTDNFDTAPVVRLSVTSNEPVDDPGSGNTSPDWEVGSSTLVRLRAERSGTGTGRVYTITVTATDAAGNSSSATVTVTVPKSESQ